jgi:CDP-glucose 4,6-dehydratase
MNELNFYKGKKVLVTGHTGFKGAWLVQWLILLGADVIGYALEDTDNTKLFKELDLQSQVLHYPLNINSISDLKTVFEQHQPEIVFHLAAQAIVKTSYENPIETFQTNVIGTANVLEAIRSVDSVKVAVLVTSDKCYKNEEKKFGFTENDAMGGDDPYSASKACAELVINSYRKSFFSEENTTKIVSVRAGNILGGGDWSKDRIVVDCMHSIENDKTIFLRDPSAVRPWQHVLDATYAYLIVAIYALQSKDFVPAWNFGPSEKDVTTVEELVQQIISHYGKGNYENVGKRTYHEANFLKLNVELASEKLNWKLRWDQEKLIKKTVDWYIDFKQNSDAKKITIAQINEYSSEFTI